MNAYFYDRADLCLEYISTIKNEELEFIKRNGIEFNDTTYIVISMKYNITMQSVIVRCKRDE